MAKTPAAVPVAPVADTEVPVAPVAATTAPEAPVVPAAAEAPAKPEKAPKAPKIEREKQNGQTKPAEGTLTRKLWDIIDQISAKNAAPATRKEVMEAAAAGAFNTAMSASLYSHWRKFHGLTGTAAPGRAAKAETETPAVAGETPAAPEAPVAPVAPEAPAAPVAPAE